MLHNRRMYSIKGDVYRWKEEKMRTCGCVRRGKLFTTLSRQWFAWWTMIRSTLRSWPSVPGSTEGPFTFITRGWMVYWQSFRRKSQEILSGEKYPIAAWKHPRPDPAVFWTCRQHAAASRTPDVQRQLPAGVGDHQQADHGLPAGTQPGCLRAKRICGKSCIRLLQRQFPLLYRQWAAEGKNCLWMNWSRLPPTWCNGMSGVVKGK